MRRNIIATIMLMLVLCSTGAYAYEYQTAEVGGMNVLATADFDKDGNPDIAISKLYETGISILLGDGSLGMSWNSVVVRIPTSQYLNDFTTADMNLDGNEDLIVCTGIKNDAVEVWVALGDGNGNFPTIIETYVRALGTGMASGLDVGQFNTDVDMIPDVAVASSNGPWANGTLSVLLGVGDGTFAAPVEYAADDQPAGAGGKCVVTGDYDEDGGDDIAIANTRGSSGNGTISIFLGDRLGAFGSRVDYSTCHWNPGFLDNLPAYVDTVDSHLDLVTCDKGPSDVPGNKISVFRGDGAGGFTRNCVDVQSMSGSDLVPISGVIEDFVACGSGPPTGILDIAVTVGPKVNNSHADSLLLLQGDGLGGFTSICTYYTGAVEPHFPVAQYFGGTPSLPDVAIGDKNGRLISVMSLDSLSGCECEPKTGVINRPPEAHAQLFQNSPNPFGDGSTRIEYSLNQSAQVTLKIYDVAGRLVKTINEGMRPEGRHFAVWNGLDGNGNQVSSGVYFYRLETNGLPAMSKKMHLVR